MSVAPVATRALQILRSGDSLSHHLEPCWCVSAVLPPGSCQCGWHGVAIRVHGNIQTVAAVLLQTKTLSLAAAGTGCH